MLYKLFPLFDRDTKGKTGNGLRMNQVEPLYFSFIIKHFLGTRRQPIKPL